MEFISHSVDETERFAERFAERLGGREIILFSGEMGAGKTAFTRGIAERFGCAEDVTSPTFALVNEYRPKNGAPIYHFDLYRLTGFEDLYAIGFFDYLDRGLIIVEWSENVPELERELEREPNGVVRVSIEKISGTERKITVSGKALD